MGQVALSALTGHGLKALGAELPTASAATPRRRGRARALSRPGPGGTARARLASPGALGEETPANAPLTFLRLGKVLRKETKQQAAEGCRTPPRRPALPPPPPP